MAKCTRCGKAGLFLILKDGLCGTCHSIVHNEEYLPKFAPPALHVSDADKTYNVVDVETPNNNNDRVCSISITRVFDSSVLWTKSYLVNPEVLFSSFNESLTGITAEMVRNKPTFPKTWDMISRDLQDGLFVAHNARFDLSVLFKCLHAYGLSCDPIHYIDTLEIARNILPDLTHYGLNNICETLNISLEHHHSDSDSLACASILTYCVRNGIDVSSYIHIFYPNSINYEKSKTKNFHSTHASATTMQTNTLRSIVKSVCTDGQVTKDEVIQLREWINNHSELSKEFPYALIQSSIEESLRDGVLESQELQQLFKTFLFLLDPLSYTFPCNNIDIAGKMVCLSGNFDYGTKEEVEQFLTSFGATIHPRVISKLDYLIVGNQASSEWSFGQYGQKIKQAIQLQMKGKPIKILKEADLMGVLQNLTTK